MESNNFKIESVSVSVLLGMSISYLARLSEFLPSNYLKDTCAGARASLYVLYRYFAQEE